MDASDVRTLAPLLGSLVRGRFVRRLCRPDPLYLGLELGPGETLGLCCEPGATALGLCAWAWPRGGVPDLLRSRLQGTRLSAVNPVPGEPALRFELAGGGALLWEAIGRSSNLLLLSEKGAILWGARLLKGSFRTGAPGEPWTPPPPRKTAAGPPREGPFSPESYLKESGPEALRAGLLARGRRRALATLDREARGLARRREAILGDRAEGEAWTALAARARALLAQGDLGRRGLASLEVTDYAVQPPESVTVELDPALSLRENAEVLFRRAKRGRARIEKTAALLETVALKETVLTSRREEAVTEESLAVLYPEEPRRAAGRTPSRREAALPKGVTRLELPRGFAGYAGRTAAANDAVTFRLGRGEDFWFHAADYPGCHVVVRNPSRLEQCPPDVERAAALHAARHSGAPVGGRVAVVTARCKNLRRVPGAPGRVMMARARTLFVELGTDG